MISIKQISHYWDAQPCNIRHSAKPLFSKEYFDEVEARKRFVEPHTETFADFAKWRNKNVLEIGCGIGTDAVRFARAGARYVGVDVSERSVDIAVKRFKLFGLRGTFHVANAERLSEIVPIKPFDLVYSFGVIHHTPHPSKVVNEVHKFMHDRSVFRLMVYAKQSWKSWMIEAGLCQPEAQSGCPLVRTYDRDTISKLLKNFRIVKMSQAHIFPFNVNSYIHQNYVMEPWFSQMPIPMFEMLEKRLGWHLLIECKKINK